MSIAYRFLSYSAPSGAACKLAARSTWRSAGAHRSLGYKSYKHRAPLEHIAQNYQPILTFRAKLLEPLNLEPLNLELWQLWKHLTVETPIMGEDDGLGASPDAEFVEKI